MTDSSYGDLASTAFDGISDFGASVIGGGITFFDVKPDDMEAVEQTLEQEQRRGKRSVHAREVPRLDAFTRQYIETALWSTNDESDERGGDPLDKNYSSSDISDETMKSIVEDCADFQEKYSDLLSESGIDDERAGHCFWLSRSGHGSGFFDEDTIDEEFQDPLQEAAESYGNFDLYVGDDGEIHGSGPSRPPSGTAGEAHRPILRQRPVVRSAPPRPRYVGEARTSHAARDLPTTNISWRDIPRGSKVELVGHSYVVTKPDGSQASAYWSGHDAAVAQRTLDSMAKAGARGQRVPLPMPRGFHGALRPGQKRRR